MAVILCSNLFAIAKNEYPSGYEHTEAGPKDGNISKIMYLHMSVHRALYFEPYVPKKKR